MKKILIFNTVLFLASCVNPTESLSSIVSSTTISEIPSSEAFVLPNLVFSKVITGTASRNNVIELYNASELPVELNGIRIDFYSNGSLEVTASIPLQGLINPRDYYLIGSANQTIENISISFDYVYQNGSLPFNGNDYMELIYQTDPIDVMGYLGSDLDYSKNVTMIRLGTLDQYQASVEYDDHSFIRYIPDYFQSLGNDNHQIKTFDQLYAGPQLEERYKALTYVEPGSTTTGGGGAVITYNSSVADGDTAFFSAGNGFPGGSVRYYYINTPEVDGSYTNAEPWGYVASKYHKEYIMRNKQNSTFYVQSIPGGALKEVNNRNLGLIWVNGQLAQFLIIREGLSENVGLSYGASDLALTDRDVPYLTFLRFAEQQAKLNGWGTKGYPTKSEGEKSPDWNYQAQGGLGALATTNPVWFPHIELPW
ncbi:MAG: hypothetical protein RIS53_11 [Bacillota bacterium]